MKTSQGGTAVLATLAALATANNEPKQRLQQHEEVEEPGWHVTSQVVHECCTQYHVCVVF